MSSVGAHVGTALVSVLLEVLVRKQIISASEAEVVLDDAANTLGELGNNEGAGDAMEVLDDIKSKLAKDR
jgi:hypothetical protein